MDAIKKKMQAMKIEKDNALDRADAAEEKVRQMQEKLERVEEELRDTQKKMVQVENDCDKAQEDLAAANASLEEKEKKLQEPRVDSAVGGGGGNDDDHCPPAAPFHTLTRICSPAVAFPILEDDDVAASPVPIHQLISVICLQSSAAASTPSPSAASRRWYLLISRARASSPPSSLSSVAVPVLRLSAAEFLPYLLLTTATSTHLIRNRASSPVAVRVPEPVSRPPPAQPFAVPASAAMSKVDKGGAQQTSLLDVLKKKMRQAREEAEAAKDEADEVKRHLEEERKKREDAEAEVAALNRRIVLVEEDLERTEDRLKAEGEVAAMNRRTQLLDEELERAEERLKVATEKMEEASQNCDESERARKSMETRSQQDEERANILEVQVEEAKVIAEDADRKYEEVVSHQSVLFCPVPENPF
ncbi:hypothetical protein QR680_009531 [Steinernema hermaphroditum]|uniref:Tropomyosin n=1 Tax=Steinernema hermaphroditum TaxID=289476 RepID=A0AA39ILY3_9BILA|nr:hypothetical protein QR680_009531 [Steinernema hermaphroditum]